MDERRHRIGPDVNVVVAYPDRIGSRTSPKLEELAYAF
jgi:hypothetical protein